MSVPTLIADDSEFARKIIRLHLERFGCHVVAEAESGAQAVSLFRPLRPVLVTLDVVMPHVEGIDALTAFRLMRQEDPAVTIVVISAVPFAKIRDTFIAEGALTYMVKPFIKYYFEQLRRKLELTLPDRKQGLQGLIRRA